MRFKKYVLNEIRGNILEFDKGIDIIEKRCKLALEQYRKGNIIYRGIPEFDFGYDVFIIDPKKYTRVSAYTKNYYTLINDNSIHWKGYPKRSKSLICATSISITKGYGTPYVVFPYDGSKIGLCPISDYWFSFLYSIKMGDLDRFNNTLELLLSRCGININNAKTYSQLKNKFSEFDKKIKELVDSDEIAGEEYFVDLLKTVKATWMEDYIPGKDTLMEYIKDLLSPQRNDFSIKKIGDKLPRDREVWTDGESVLINADLIKYELI